MPLLSEITRQLISSGLHPSLPVSAIPFWEEGENVVFQEIGVQPQPGQFLLFNKLLAERGLGLLETRIGATPNAFWGTATSLFRGIGGTPVPTNVTRLTGTYTGSNSDLWSVAEFGDDILATNGVDAVQYWSTGAPANFVDIDTISDLLGTFRAQILRPWGPFMMALNTDTNDQEVLWCDEDDITTWTADPGNLARSLIMRGLNSPIIAACPLGNGLGIYGRDELWFLSFVGAPFGFSQDRLLEGIGAFGKHSIACVGRRHFGMGPRGIFVTDGATFNYVDQPSIHDYVYDRLNKPLAERTITWHDPEFTMVYFSYPLTEETGETVGFNYSTGQWSLHGYYRTAAESAEVFDFPVTIDDEGNVWSQGVGTAVSSGDPRPFDFKVDGSIKTGWGVTGYGELGYGGSAPIPNDNPGDGKTEGASILIVLNKSDGTTIDIGQALDTASAFIRSKALDFDKIDWSKFLDQIFLEITNVLNASNLVLKIYYADEPEATFTLGDTINLSGDDTVNPSVPDARYYKFEFEDSTITTKWNLSKMAVFGKLTAQDH